MDRLSAAFTSLLRLPVQRCQIVNLYTLFKTQDSENHTLLSGTHPSRRNKGVPPLGGQPSVHGAFFSILALPEFAWPMFTKNKLTRTGKSLVFILSINLITLLVNVSIIYCYY